MKGTNSMCFQGLNSSKSTVNAFQSVIKINHQSIFTLVMGELGNVSEREIFDPHSTCFS